MTWNGNKVAKKLNLSIEGGEHMESLMGIAYRNNPKRAHLLVSKILGKHIPQKPSIIAQAGTLLARQIHCNIIGNPMKESEIVREVKNILGVRGLSTWNEEMNHPEIIVMGYAETATALGASVAEALGAPYFHSTRYPKVGSEYGAFSEEHSHAAAHKIFLQDTAIIEKAKTIVLVDDELSTGNTIINTIINLQENTLKENYMVATLTDLRGKKDMQRITEFASKNSLKISIEALYKGTIGIPDNALEIAKKAIAEIESEKNQEGKETKAAGKVSHISIPHISPTLHAGISATELRSNREIFTKIGENLAEKLPEGEKTLILGIEEDMYYPLCIGEGLEKSGCNITYSTSTLSPVIACNAEDYAIQNSITYSIGENEPARYAYNILEKNYSRIILLLKTASEQQKIKELIGKLIKEGINVTILTEDGESNE